MKNGLIFDMDGCLIDSSDVQKTALLESYKLVVGDDKCPTYEEYIKYTGDSIDNVFKKLGLPKEMAPIYRQISRDSVDKVRINWDLIEVIKKYKEYGCAISICTGKDHDRAVAILEHYKINDLFDVVIGSDEVSAPKPAPDSILRALSEMCVTGDHSYMIGDGQNDIQSAQNAGIKSILTRWYGIDDSIGGANYVVDTVCELDEILRELLL